MPRPSILFVALLAAPTMASAAAPVPLDAAAYKPGSSVLITQINWGRSWKCGQYENAQLEALTFTRLPLTPDAPSLELKSPSALAPAKGFVPYVLVVQPGEYALTGLDVKVAKSENDVGHFKLAQDALLKDGKAVGGSLTVNAGEIVYVGHFGLDCAAEPFFWRYYIETREDFQRYVEGFRKKYPSTKEVPVQFRLFSTQMFGKPFSLSDPPVK